MVWCTVALLVVISSTAARGLVSIVAAIGALLLLGYLHRTAEADGVFCYTFFEGVGEKR